MSSIFFGRRRSVPVRRTMIPSIRHPLQFHAIPIEIGIPTSSLLIVIRLKSISYIIIVIINRHLLII